jgi:hypothetical protein
VRVLLCRTTVLSRHGYFLNHHGLNPGEVLSRASLSGSPVLDGARSNRRRNANPRFAWYGACLYFRTWRYINPRRGDSNVRRMGAIPIHSGEIAPQTLLLHTTKLLDSSLICDILFFK